MTQKVLFKIRGKDDDQTADWTKGMQKLKHELTVFNKQKSLMMISRWRILINGILSKNSNTDTTTKPKQAPNPRKINSRWKRLI